MIGIDHFAQRGRENEWTSQKRSPAPSLFCCLSEQGVLIWISFTFCVIMCIISDQGPFETGNRLYWPKRLQLQETCSRMNYRTYTRHLFMAHLSYSSYRWTVERLSYCVQVASTYSEWFWIWWDFTGRWTSPSISFVWHHSWDLPLKLSNWQTHSWQKNSSSGWQRFKWVVQHLWRTFHL